MATLVDESDVKGPKRLNLVKLLIKGNDYHPFYSLIQNNMSFQVARFSHDFIFCTIFFVHEKYFDHARNRARSHDKIFFVISNPGPGCINWASNTTYKSFFLISWNSLTTV